eukprot:GHVL01009226.1.p1 GENE.GHVL01009226.1~~GHVL01009226.1.p1  ORF type:complete len:334 (-),score=58.06 GHVL01009226.1:529-1410(-)
MRKKKSSKTRASENNISLPEPAYMKGKSKLSNELKESRNKDESLLIKAIPKLTEFLVNRKAKKEELIHREMLLHNSMRQAKEESLVKQTNEDVENNCTNMANRDPWLRDEDSLTRNSTDNLFDAIFEKAGVGIKVIGHYKASQFRKMSDYQLCNEIDETREKIVYSAFLKGFKKQKYTTIDKPYQLHEIPHLRRKLAQLYTIMTERSLGIKIRIRPPKHWQKSRDIIVKKPKNEIEELTKAREKYTKWKKIVKKLELHKRIRLKSPLPAKREELRKRFKDEYAKAEIPMPTYK